MKFQKIFFGICIMAATSAQADSKKCYIDLTGSPYCVSKANAKRFCDSIKPDDETLLKTKKCFKEMESMAPNAQMVQTMCLGGFKQTGDPDQDSSNCNIAEPLKQSSPVAR